MLRALDPMNSMLQALDQEMSMLQVLDQELKELQALDPKTSMLQALDQGMKELQVLDPEQYTCNQSHISRNFLSSSQEPLRQVQRRGHFHVCTARSVDNLLSGL